MLAPVDNNGRQIPVVHGPTDELPPPGPAPQARMPRFLPAGCVLPYAGSSETVPLGFLPCNGQQLFCDEYPDLFAAIGHLHGPVVMVGGRLKFQVPDLRARFVLGTNDAPREGRSERQVGESGGQEDVTLGLEHIPPHNHGLDGVTLVSDTTPHNYHWGIWNGNRSRFVSSRLEGGGQAHPNMPPFLALNYIIST